MHFLFISSTFPKNLRTDVYGIYKRMGLFLDAIKEIASLDMLFYVPRTQDISKSFISQAQHSLSEYFGTKINLNLCTRFENKNKNSFWKTYGAGCFSFFKQSFYEFRSGKQQLRAFEECMSNKPDAIFAHRLNVMPPLLLSRKTLPPIFFDLDDIEHVSFFRSINKPPNWRSKPLYYLQIPALLWGERQAVRLAHRTFVCSDSDKEYLMRFWHMPRVVTIPNAIDIPELKPSVKDSTLLFLGSYGYRPNIIAAEFLIEKVMPIIRQVIPEVTLIIAGSHPHNIRFFDKPSPNIEFTGFVDNLDALYQRSRVVCCPILSGGGTRVKIIEAAAYGKPIVSTRIGAEGIEMRNDKELLLHDDPNSFAEACITLLKDNNLCTRLGTAARAVVKKHYDRNNIIRLIQQHCNEAFY